LSPRDRWSEDEPPECGPSAPTDLRFNPLATGIAVFTGVAVPIVVVGYTWPAGPNNLIIILGVLIGLVAGIVAGCWLTSRDGRVVKGPRL